MISPSLYLARPFQIIPDHQSSPTGRYNGFQYCHDTALGRNNDSTEIHYTALGRYNGFIYCHYRGFGDLSDPGPGRRSGIEILVSLALPTVAQADALRAREIRSTMEVLTTSIV